VLIESIGKKDEENIAQRDKEGTHNMISVGVKPGNALSITRSWLSFLSVVTRPVEILTLINGKISEPWHFDMSINCYGYKHYAEVGVSVLCLLYYYYPVFYG